MRLAFMGTPDFALPSLKALIASPKHELGLIITQPDKPSGRGRKVSAPPVKEEALKHGIPLLQPSRLKNQPEVYEALKNYAPDAVIVVAYGKLVPAGMLGIPRFGFINVHASLLPELRGAAPINWAIISGMPQTGVSIMHLDEGLDTGPVYSRQTCPIDTDDDTQSLGQKLSELGAHELLTTLDKIEQGLRPEEQDHTRATYAPILKKEDGIIDWNKDAASIGAMIRGLFPWPCAMTRMGGKALRILKADRERKDHNETPGSLIKDSGALRIACRDGFILPKLLQMEGKQALEAKAFANGLRTSYILLGDEQ